jgi:PhnB protein
MSAKASTTPAGYQTVMPYLRVKGAAQALAFYKKAFGARERFHLTMGDRIGHAEIEINGSVIMFSEEFPEMGILGPKSIKGTTVTIALMVANCDAAVKKAVAAGAKLTRPATDEFYGDRSAQVEDPFGHVWMIQQPIETVPPKEMQRRLDAMMAEPQSAPARKAAKKKV